MGIRGRHLAISRLGELGAQSGRKRERERERDAAGGKTPFLPRLVARPPGPPNISAATPTLPQPPQQFPRHPDSSAATATIPPPPRQFPRQPDSSAATPTIPPPPRQFPRQPDSSAATPTIPPPPRLFRSRRDSSAATATIPVAGTLVESAEPATRLSSVSRPRGSRLGTPAVSRYAARQSDRPAPGPGAAIRGTARLGEPRKTIWVNARQAARHRRRRRARNRRQNSNSDWRTSIRSSWHSSTGGPTWPSRPRGWPSPVRRPLPPPKQRPTRGGSTSC